MPSTGKESSEGLGKPEMQSFREGVELVSVCKGRLVTWDVSFLLCALPLTQKIIELFMRGYVPTALLVLKSCISHGMSVSVLGKWSYVFRTLSLQSAQKLKREKVVGNMGERGCLKGKQGRRMKRGEEEEIEWEKSEVSVFSSEARSPRIISLKVPFKWTNTVRVHYLYMSVYSRPCESACASLLAYSSSQLPLPEY